MKTRLLLLAYPLLEIAGFVIVGNWLGLFATLGLVILSGIVGVMILQSQARMAGRGMRSSLGDLRGAVSGMADGALVSLGAVLLMIPGFVSDLIALPLLIPPLRRALIGALSRRVTVRGGPTRPGRAADATIIDATYYEVDPDRSGQPSPDRPSGWTRH